MGFSHSLDPERTLRDRSLDQLVGEREQIRRYIETERLGGSEVDHKFEVVGCTTGRSAGFTPLRMRPV
jgi:hypothetical protein